MELEATILERLQELRKWQVEQQERLLQQQQEQRDLLNVEQDRMYQALGLSVQDIVLDDSTAQEVSESPAKRELFVNSASNSPSNSSNSSINSSTKFKLKQLANKSPPVVCDEENYQKQTDNQDKLQLKVPPLQLTTNGYLSLRSSIEGFSPRSEIPQDNISRVPSESYVTTPEKCHRRNSDFEMEGVEPLDKPANRHITIDDLPVPSPKKDFTTLLEESLRDCNDDINASHSTKPTIKRPFLRKGEGLARFKPNPNGSASNRRTRPRSVSLGAGMTSATSKTNVSKLNDTPRSSKVTSGKSLAIPPVAQTKLNLRNVAPPKKKVRSKSLSAVPARKPMVHDPRVTAPVDLNTSSDFETKNCRELEEMRIFELLEEKAEHSSFCSNSSAVLSLFRQSTPLKIKNIPSNARDPRQRLLDQKPKHESSDTSLEEIVKSTKSNRSVPGSPVTKIRETVIQKDIVFSKWDTGPFGDENSNVNSSPVKNKRNLHCTVAAGSYKTLQHTKHTTIQYNNNNSNQPVMHSDEEEIACENLQRRNVDVDYGKSATNATGENDGANVSLHVRFSEYNEYKTIGLTDTSIVSNDSNRPRNYMDDKAWSDRSTSPDTSDVETILSNSNTKMLKALPVHKDSHNSGDEFSDRATDDEQYTSGCSHDTSYDEEDQTISEIAGKPIITNISGSEDESDVCNDSGSTIRQENDEIETKKDPKVLESVDTNGTIFKSELLKTRLLELEREIDIFRKENAALAKQRKRLADEQRQLQKEFRQKEENFAKERQIAEDSMQEEKKRLAREKSALENRLRDAREKSLQSKQERQEIQILREQMDELREESCQKESRWNAAQARQKSQIRVLQTENGKLKQELEKLRQLRTKNSKLRKPAAVTNTRAIHQINKQIDFRRKPSQSKDTSSDDEVPMPQVAYEEYEFESLQANNQPIVDQIGIDEDGSKMIVYNGASQCPQKTEEDLRKKRNLYANLLNVATEGLRGREKVVLGRSSDALEKSKIQSQTNTIDKTDTSERILNDSFGQRNEDNSDKRTCDFGTVNYNRSQETTSRRSTELAKSPGSRLNNSNQQESKRLLETVTARIDKSNTPINKQDIREVQCPDGHVELWYPNGNVKKIFPDRNVTKMIYYNGDVRETAEDGTVKYFYASTRIWHTTLPDGLEILEFPDGQVERRMKNGTIEISLPDGSVRLMQSDGTEKWVLPDGTIVETFPNGEKILLLPNGQREIHTEEHKRREYPDGTVKLVYPDGTQETRYSTGRVRVKDKDGNLLLDEQH